MKLSRNKFSNLKADIERLRKHANFPSHSTLQYTFIPLNFLPLLPIQVFFFCIDYPTIGIDFAIDCLDKANLVYPSLHHYIIL